MFIGIRKQILCVFCGIKFFYFDRIELYEMTKAEVVAAINEGIFKPQHGGKSGDSGTFCYNGTMEALGATPIEFEW